MSGLVWAGVDIIEDVDGNEYVVEINGAPGTPFDVEAQAAEEEHHAKDAKRSG